MGNQIPGVMIAAPKSGSGKTLLTCGLLEVFRNRGLRPAACKCGPDYIDPMFHNYVLGTPGMNLDLFFQEPEQVRCQLERLLEREASGIAVVEGVMGYYDGIGGTSSRASAWETAAALEIPTLLVVDGKGASLSLAAEAEGFLSFREDSRICGVILNRVSGMMYERLKPVLEKQTGIPVLGYLPESESYRLESRHLGLFLPGEIDRLREKIRGLAEQLEKSVDIDAIIHLAGGVRKEKPKTEDRSRKKESRNLHIGVARDEAFCFYYQENLELLRQMGADPVFFSPLHDDKVPDGIDGLILGGGYPENFGKQLSDNRSMLASVKEAIDSGMPLLAECGGFLYLHRELEGDDGVFYPMAGVVASRAFRYGKLRRFGYVFLTSPEGMTIRGHEFHYWESETPGEDWLARKPEVSDGGEILPGKRSWRCMHGTKGQVMGFPHLYYLSNPEFLRMWLEECRKWNQKGERLYER